MGPEPTADERAGIEWWNALTEAERAQALRAAGWRSDGKYTPSAADAWVHHKRDLQARIAWWNGLGKAERERALDRAGDGNHIPSAADAWREHRRRLAVGGRTGAGRTNHIAIGDLAKDPDAYFETFGGDSKAFIKCSDCGSTGTVETNGAEWVGPVRMESCETCGGAGRLRDANDDEVEP
jgi:hypothetical protein